MDTSKLRSWMYARQGLERREEWSPRETLVRTGWLRSVGGVNPYLALFARTGAGREAVDSLAAAYELYELPSMRGCTYVLPAEHFALGLASGRGFNSTTEVAAARKLGVTDAEVDALKVGILAALADGPMSPADLKTPLGGLVRNLGEEGKRRGLTTILPLALGLLQAEGAIRRKPVNGRFDTQRYAYELWQPPIGALPTDAEMAAELTRLFFTWIGAATLKEFRNVTCVSAKMTQAVFAEVGVGSFAEGTDLLCLPEARADFAAYEIPQEPVYRLVGTIDNYMHLEWGTPFWINAEDLGHAMPSRAGGATGSTLQELESHAILDRGRVIGLWEFDPDAGKIVWYAWTAADNALRAEIDRTERFIRDDLGDARSFSLDSPSSRRPRIEALQKLAAG